MARGDWINLTRSGIVPGRRDARRGRSRCRRVVGGGEPSTVTTVHRETVPLFGRGVYRYDSLTVGSGSGGSTRSDGSRIVDEPLVTGQPATTVEHYTTFVTGALDLGALMPAALISAVLVLRRQVTGYVIAFCLAGFAALLGPAPIGTTVAQLAAGVQTSAVDLVIFVVSFIALSGAAEVLLTGLRRAGSPRDRRDAEREREPQHRRREGVQQVLGGVEGNRRVPRPRGEEAGGDDEQTRARVHPSRQHPRAALGEQHEGEHTEPQERESQPRQPCAGDALGGGLAGCGRSTSTRQA
jgi:hypothetical protein